MNHRMIKLMPLVLALGFLPAPCVDAQEKTSIKKIVNRYGNYTIYIDYENRKAQAGNQNLEINVLIETLAKDGLKLIKCEECDSSKSPFSQVTRPVPVGTVEPGPTNSSYQTKYRFIAAIKSGIEPQEYDVDLRFEPPNADQLRANDKNYADIIENFPLFVGVSENGRLSVKEGSKTKPELCASGHNHTFTLVLKNGFHDYDVNLQKVTLSSTPEGLVSQIISSDPPGKIVGRNTIVFDIPFSIAPSQEPELTIDVKMAGMSPRNYLSGFDEDSQLGFKFVYDDGKGRKLSDFTYARALRMQASSLVLFTAVALGISAGILLMSVWKILRFEGQGMRKGFAIATTVIIGLIVSMLALQGELNISLEAFKIRASYDKPFMLFVLSMVATVMGTPALRKFFGLDKSATQAPKPATAGSGST
jgi:hypothetical protein